MVLAVVVLEELERYSDLGSWVHGYLDGSTVSILAPQRGFVIICDIGGEMNTISDHFSRSDFLEAVLPFFPYSIV